MKIFIFLFYTFIGSICSYALESYQVPNGGNLDIDEHTVCQKVTNSHASGKDIFVPTKTAAEWQAFRDNLPAGVTLSACCAAPTSISYSSATYSWGTPGTDINTLSATVGGGTPTSFSVSPALPTGIALNTTTGDLTGRPTAITASASYTVTATNSCGSTNTSLTIDVFDATAASTHLVDINAGGPGGSYVDSVSSNSTTTVTVGTTVRWFNNTNGQHDSMSTDAPQKWTDVAQYGKNGEQFLTINMTGTLPYICGVHSGMTGSIVSNP